MTRIAQRVFFHQFVSLVTIFETTHLRL